MVEQESQGADEALAAHLSAVAQQQASLVRWLLFLSIGVVIAGLLAAAAILGLVITIPYNITIRVTVLSGQEARKVVEIIVGFLKSQEYGNARVNLPLPQATNPARPS